MKPLNQSIISNAVSNATLVSSNVDIRQAVNFSLQVSASTGSLAGTFQVQISNTPCLNIFRDFGQSNNPAIWTNLGTPLTFAQASTATSQVIPKTDIAHVALRVVFTDSSSGTNTSRMTVNLATQNI